MPRSSVRVQRSSVGCSGVQEVVRWLAVRQARVHISTRHPLEVSPTESEAVKLWRWASANVMKDCMNVCIVKIKRNMQKEWLKAIKPFKKIF